DFHVTGVQTCALPISPVWVELRDGRTRPAFRIGYDLLRSKSLSDEHRAALLSALATAAFDNGMYKVARQMAHDSLALYSNQWLAHRTLLSIYIAEKDYRAAAEHLKSVTPPARSRGWDEP